MAKGPGGGAKCKNHWYAKIKDKWTCIYCGHVK